MFSLQGRKALVTGATGGIGEDIARILHAQGAEVTISGTREEKLQELANSLKERVHIATANLKDKESIKKLAATAEEKMGKIDILVCNAGITKDNLSMRMSEEDFEEVMFKLFAPELQLGFLKFLKGTPVRYKYKEHGFVFDENPPYQIIRSNYLTEDELNKIVKLEHALEIYWNKKRAVNTLRYITQKYSSFDFLMGLGEYFGTKKEYHQYSLTDVFDIITEYAKLTHPNDLILQELIAVDYYLHYKVKPKTLYLEEVSREEKQRVIAEQKLNHHRFRYVVLPLSFDFETFLLKNEVISEAHRLIVEYSGETKARAVFPNTVIPC